MIQGMFAIKMKNLPRLLLVALLLVSLMASIATQNAQAQSPQCTNRAPQQLYGRNVNCGYFLNNYVPFGGNSGSGLLTNINDQFGAEAFLGINDVNRFVSVVRYHLNVNGNCNPASGSVVDQHRRNAAAFIVLTMQGAPAGTPANAPCVSSAYSFARWESLVRQYNAAGLINFNEAGWYNLNTRIQDAYLDPAWYPDPDCAFFGVCIVPSIVVRAPNNTIIYMIKKDCANPIGIPGVLTPLDHGFSVTPTASTTANPNTEVPTSATFHTGASYSGSPSTTTYDRKFYYIKAGTATETTINDPGPVAHTNTGTSFNFPDVTINIAGLGLDIGDQVCARNTVSPAAGTADPTGDILTVTVASRSDVGCFTIVRLPYHRAFGGDVRVGSGFKNSAGNCATDIAARVIGWNNDGPYTGAGSQLAVFAFHDIGEFVSGQLRTNATQPKPLTFANTNPSRNNEGTGTYGGGLMDGQAACAPDYYDDGVASATGTLGGSTGANVPEAVYSHTGNLTITGGNLGLGTGSRTFYVDGDVTITDNVTYAPGSYNDIGNIPSFRLIVRGNIYVMPDVSELDGIYVAQPRSDGTKGRFYTCAPGGSPPTTAAQLNDTGPNGCRFTKLTVYGAVIADLIKFTRSSGTLSQAANTALSPSQDGVSSTSGEVFFMTPEAWLTSDFGGGAEFDSVTTLPPVL